MELSLALLGGLVVLALIDSTSFGTLLIPIWLLMSPGRVRIGRLLAYLGTVAAFYFAVGVVIVLGAGAFLDAFGEALSARPVKIAQLLLGIGLFAFSFRLDSKKARAREGSGRLTRWRERAMGADAAGASGGSMASLMGLALGAAALEVATMLPYLAAIGLLTTSGIGWPLTGLVLAAYCMVMVLPALVLLAGRLFAARAVEPVLERLNRWMTKNAASMTGWVVGIAGFLIARDAATALGWLG